MQSQQIQSGKGLVSAQNARLQALKSKHEALSRKIERESQHISVSDGLISRLKKEKLLLKEEIEGLKQVS